MNTMMPGNPFPLGATKQPNGWNFAIYSALPVKRLILAPPSHPKEITSFSLDPELNRTGSIWHIFVPSEDTEILYAFYAGENLLIDPYAKLIHSGKTYGSNAYSKAKYKLEPIAIATSHTDFDWEGDTKPGREFTDLVIYEMHVRGFTQHPSSHAKQPGTYLGLIEKIPYLKQLGINAVELLPVFDFDEADNLNKNPKTKQPLVNYWGYAPLSFFAPMQRYASSDDPVEALSEFKEMVKALHKAGIEVILDIVFNHTGEGNQAGPMISWKGFCPEAYYMINEHGEYLNYSGCGNTLNCNHPIVSDMLIESLRYWVTEMHVDGFRFDLASIMTRGQDGTPLSTSPLLDRITEDPILSHVKLIAEPWDAAGLHQVGFFYQSPWHGPEQWMEWNDDYRNSVRHFIKGSDGFAGKFATKLCGSQDLYGYCGSPQNSLNYVACHDGYSLRDVVSYHDKHNEENGEQNRDGVSLYDTWNCGVEGETKQPHIEMLRQRQMKNFCLALFVSLGVPMVHMGDEYGHSKKGNNNTWCQDNERNWFCWNELAAQSSLVHFWQKMIQFRHDNPLLKRKSFLGMEDIIWHGKRPKNADWSTSSHFVAYQLLDHEKQEDLYIAFNADHEAVTVELPAPPKEKKWILAANTALLPPQDFVEESASQRAQGTEVKMAPYSAILLKARTQF